MSESEKPEGGGGVITAAGLLDLTGIATAADLARLKNIENAGLVLVREDVQSALGGVSVSGVGAVVPVPAGIRVRVQGAQGALSAAAFAPPDGAQFLLAVSGQVFVPEPIREIAYSGVVVTGVVCLPEEGREAFEQAVTHMQGHVFTYKGKPRFCAGADTFGRAFLEQLPAGTSLVLFGAFEFA